MKLRACLLVLAACFLSACATTPAGAPAGPAPSPIVIVVTATPTSTPETLSYVVVQGDILGRIARAYGVTVAELAALNNLEDPNRLSVGQVLLIPSATPVPTTTIAASDTPTASTSTDTPAPTTVVPSETPTPAGPPATPSPDPTATPTATIAPKPTESATAARRASSATATASLAMTKAPTFAPTATFLPTAAKTATATASATATPEPIPTPSGTVAAEGAGINLTPADEVLATAMQAAMAEYGVQRVVIADARERGGARVAIGTLILTKEQENSGEELSLPLGAMLATGYRVAVLAGAAEDLDSIALVIASSEGNAVALVGARTVDIAAFVQGALDEADFVRRWVVRDF